MPKIAFSDRAFFQLFFALAENRRQDFAAYISLRQFNSNGSLPPLLAAIAAHAPPSITLEALCVACEMAPGTVEKSLSQLRALLNDFILVHASLREKNKLHALSFAGWVAEDLPENLLDNEYRIRQRKLQGLPESESRFQDALHLAHRHTKYKIAQPRKAQGTLFDQHLHLLDAYYAVARLKHACAVANAAQVFREPGQVPQPAAYQPAYADLPELGKAYFHMHKLLSETRPRPEAIGDCLTMLKAQTENFEYDDRMDLFGYLLNTAVRGMSTGEVAYAEMAFLVYQCLLEKGLLIESGTINGIHLKNYVSILFRTGRLKMARNFVADYEKWLTENDRKLLLPYCLGLLEFQAGDVRKAIREFSNLIHLAPDDIFWGLEARSMLWKAYFKIYHELAPDEHQKMMRMYDSFRVYIARNQYISESHRTAYQNFIRIFNKLIVLMDNALAADGPAGYSALLREAEAMDLIANKRWVLHAIRQKLAPSQADTE